MDLENLFRNQYGSAGVMAVIVMVLISAIGAGMYSLSNTGLKINNNLSDGVKAQYLAEEGMQYGIARLSYESSLPDKTGTLYDKVKNLKGKPDLLSSVNKGKNVYQYTIAWPSDRDKPYISVTGIVNRAYRTVLMDINFESPVSPFDYSIFAGAGKIQMSNDAKVTGSIRTNDEIIMSNSAKVSEDAFAVGKISLSNGAEITRNKYPIAEKVTSPAYSYSSTGKALDRIISSRKDLTAGTYYVDGDFNIDNQAEIVTKGKVVIYVKGNCIFSNDSKIKGDNITIICDGNMYISNKVEIDKAVLIARGTIILSNDTKIRGAVVSTGGEVYISNSVEVVYDTTLIRNAGLPVGSDGGSSTVRFGSWTNKKGDII